MARGLVVVGAEGSNSPETLGANRSIESAKKIYHRNIFRRGVAGIDEESGEGCRERKSFV